MSHNSIEKLFSFFSTFISLLLPVTQLLVIVAEENPLLFVDTSVIVPTSLITFIISILVILYTYTFPNLRVALNRKQEEKYLTSINNRNRPLVEKQANHTDPIVPPPIYLTHGLLSIMAIPTALVSGLLFISMGLSVEEPDLWQIVLQSFLYVSLVVSTAYSIFFFLYKQYQLNNWKVNRSSRAKKAVDLAIDHSAIVELPPLRVIQSYETQGFPSRLVVELLVAKRSYQIYCDVEANEFIGVLDITKDESK